MLAAGSADKTVWLWKVTDPAHPIPAGGPLAGPTSYVEAVAFSPDGHLLAAGSADDTVWLWDVADPAKPRLASQAADRSAQASWTRWRSARTSTPWSRGAGTTRSGAGTSPTPPGQPAARR